MTNYMPAWRLSPSKTWSVKSIEEYNEVLFFFFYMLHCTSTKSFFYFFSEYTIKVARKVSSADHII